jgi:type III secretion protein D
MTALCPCLELRVLEGRQRGASLPLAAAGVLRVGSDWRNDVVLRDAAPEAQAELSLVSGQLTLKAVQGHIRVGPATVAPGESLALETYTAIDVGGARIAVGELGDARWAPLFQPQPATADADTAPQPPRASAEASGDDTTASARRSWPKRLVVGGGALAAASLSMLALAFAVAPAAPGPAQQAHRLQAVLHGAGLTALSVQAQAQGTHAGAAGAGGELVVSGYLDTHAQRVRAEQLLAAEGLPARTAFWVNEQLMAAVQDVYRVNGVTADVQAAGPGTVQVVTQVADTDQLQRIEATARRDIAGLVRLEARNAPPPRTPSPIPQIDDPGKRISSVVGGEMPYLVTQDGSRYFAGALLPTGHRVIAIDANTVQLEREGQHSRLSF